MKELGRQVHLVGIGGEGMAGLATLLLQAGYRISGSDLRSSSRLLALAAAGAKVYKGHGPLHLPPETTDLVYSSAIPVDNPEVQAAKARGLPLWPRLPALGSIMSSRQLLAVVGTHGKTTTATWTAHLLRTLVGSIGHYLGGDVPGHPAAQLGSDPLFVAEVDESDGRFTSLQADVALLTAVDSDHMETYGGVAGLHAAFRSFVLRAAKAVLCMDDPGAASLYSVRRDAFTYGLHPGARLQAVGVEYKRGRSMFELRLDGRRAGDVCLPAPGAHNVQNALGALAAGLVVGLPLGDMVEALSRVPRPRRRLEVLEENGYLVVDDYAHHPRELAAGLAALRRGWPERRIVAVFQPHRYTRTVRLAREFGTALAKADHVLVTDVYPAFESALPGVSGAQVAEAVLSRGGKAQFRPTLEATWEAVAQTVHPGDLVVCFGAGDIWRLSHKISQALFFGV
ncbi:MAG: UDP-N-acetylmuramate--L-alanine ligase [Candidatus Bipolaricaulota bacterium]